MKKGILVLALFVVQTLPVGQSFSQPHVRSSVGVSFGVFYDGLSPYGDWIAIGGGMYGWRPVGVAVGWRPYTVGRWCWTDDGWYWMSDEPWGWAAYHYGRWYYDEYYGWIWIPGYDWAPAWVEWRYGGDCIGWAPLSPYAVFSFSWGIHYRTRWYTPVTWWNFVACGHITSPNIHRYLYRTEYNTRYLGTTRTAGSVRYSGGRIRTRGPERSYVERAGNVRVEPVAVRDIQDRATERVVRQGTREEIEVYRPRIEERAMENDAVERPSRIREDGSRSLDLDMRKTDLRSREIERADGRDLRRSEEYKIRSGSERTEQRPDIFERRREDTRPRDEGNQRREEMKPSGQERRQPDVRREMPPRREVAPPPPERRRAESQERPQREYRMPPERRMETPRMEAPRNSGGERGGSGRTGRSR